MSVTDLNDVQYQIQKWWAPKFTKELRQSNIIATLLDKEYSGDMEKSGDRVRVSQIDAPEGEILTIGTDADSFNTEKLNLQYVDITADKRAVASVEVTELADLQSQLGEQESTIREALLFAVNKKMNTYLYSLMVPSTSAPDHTLTTADLNSSEVAIGRKLAAQAYWPNEQPWYLVTDPSYYSDILTDTTLASTEYGAQDVPVIGGQVGLKRYGFNVYEDSALAEDVGYAFYKDCVHLVMQKMPTFKLSDQHVNGKFSYILSVDLIFGAAVGISGDTKMIKWTT